MSPTSPRQPGGARQQAAAVKVHRDSHLIHKGGAGTSSSSSTNSSVSSSPGATATNNGGSAGRQRPAPRQKAQQQPVIIYTHSPKVIRTSPRDFMSIVQKLTGLECTAAASAAVTAAQDESSSSSNESCANAHAVAPAPPHYIDPQLLQMPPPTPLDAHFMPDIPLFGPGASEHLLAGASLYGQFPPTTVDAAAALGAAVNMHNGAPGAVFSPSMLELEAMRTTFPDYQLT